MSFKPPICYDVKMKKQLVNEHQSIVKITILFTNRDSKLGVTKINWTQIHIFNLVKNFKIMGGPYL